MSASAAGTSRLLSGITVVECTGGILSAYCGLLFADLGATAHAFEAPGGALLRNEPPLDGTGESLLYRHLTSGKRQQVLDLSSRKGRREFERLLATADVLIEDSWPGGPFTGDLSPAAIRARHPRLTALCLSQFGRTGAYADWRGNE